MRTRCAIILLGALALGGCTLSSGLYGNDEIARYVQRSDTITLSAGDAPEVNKATQIIHPWPPYVMDWRIPADGERMVGAVDRYRKGPGQQSAGPSATAIGAAAGAGAAVGAAAAASSR